MYPTFYDLVFDVFGVSFAPFKYMQSYGMMVGIAFIVGSILLILELKRKESIGQLQATVKKEGKDKATQTEVIIHPDDHVGNIAIICGIAAVVGGKLFHNLENWDDVVRDPMSALTSMSGLSFFGGLVMAILLFVWYARKNKLSILHFLDAVMPSVALGYGIGRIGCHISGDGDWGIPNDLPKPEWMSFLPDWTWAYNYPNNVLGVDLMDYYAEKGYVSITGYAFPTPLYEFAIALIMFTFLWSMRKRWTVPGIMMSAYFILSGLERLLIERIRINNEYDALGGITQAELISVALIVLGCAGLYYMPKYGQRLAKF